MIARSLSLLALACLASAAKLTLQSPRLTVLSSGASTIRTEPLSLLRNIDIPVQLSATDTLKITFQVLEKDGGKGVQPHQTFLRFYDKQTGEEGIQPLRVSPSGKVKYELNMNRPPASLPPSSTSPLSVELIIGSFVHSPLKAYLFDIIIPASHPAPRHPDEDSFHLQPEITHTFRPEQKLPPKFISLVFVGIVLAPWAVWVLLWSQISIPLPNLFSSSIVPFTSTLALFELLLVWYWVDLKLGQVLLYGSALGLVAVFTGHRALVSIGEQRVRSGTK
jgi:oligosaccharyltransferase complex subunit delta (ribophorin II)